MNVKIYQLKSPDCPYAFCGWDNRVKALFDFDDYEKVFEGNIPMGDDFDRIDILEHIFKKFNHRNDNFKGHSLSVSDIVEFNNNYYYCDSIGWQEMDSYIKG